jgi:hypothetical protein
VKRIPELLGERREAIVPPLWDGQAGARAAIEVERALDRLEDVVAV